MTQIVKEHAEAERAPFPTSGTIVDDVPRHAAERGDQIGFLRRRGGSDWQPVSYSAFNAEVRAVAKGLIASGLEVGQSVGLMSRTRYEWTLLDYAILHAGGVVVPIYETSSAEQIEWILSDSAAVGVVLEGDKTKATFDEVAANLSAVTNVWVLDAGAVDDLMSKGAHISDADLDARLHARGPQDLATIIYTSGTTGRPKGVALTHGNLMYETFNVVQGLDQIFLVPNASTLLFLPIAHVFGRLVQYGSVHAHLLLGHTADIRDLTADLASFKPTFLLAVPRVFEKVFNGAQQRATADGKGSIFDRAAGVAIAYSRALDSGGASITLKLQHSLFDKLVYGKLRAAIGGNVRWAVSGGAPLGERLGHFFRGVGITILEGYGLTETSAASTVNRPDALRVGSVGRPIPGTRVAIADDGEVLLAGPHIFQGYWHNERATHDAIDADGWFHSGDIGEIDDDGFLRITGRKKELIVTAGGKNVAPAVLEDRVRAHWLISQVMVVGDNKPFVGALVTIDPETFPVWKQQNNKDAAATVAELKGDPDLLAAVQSAVDDANKAVSNAEAIKKFAILDIDWTEEGGQLTPSLKLKRNVVLAEYGDQVEALYS
jgi:long-chain acyl-CoA synthetase